MNSVGGKTANNSFWVTTLMYTENEYASIQRRLLRWQAKGQEGNKDKGPDLIQWKKEIDY